VLALARSRELLLLLGGTAELAVAWGADGSHGRGPGEGLRSAPVHDLREIREAERDGAALLFLSPVFATRSHPEARPLGPAMFKPLNETTAEADARMYVDELNRRMGLNLPEDAGYDTVGGYVTTTLGRIPEAGTVFEHEGVRFTVLEAEPQKVNRVRIEVIPQPAEEPAEAAPTGM